MNSYAKVISPFPPSVNARTPTDTPIPLARSPRDFTLLCSYNRKGDKQLMADKTLTCRDCSTNFTFTEGEQDFYGQKGYSEPARCPDCRAAKKAARDNGYGNSYGGSYSTGGGY